MHEGKCYELSTLTVGKNDDITKNSFQNITIGNSFLRYHKLILHSKLLSKSRNIIKLKTIFFIKRHPKKCLLWKHML